MECLRAISESRSNSFTQEDARYVRRRMALDIDDAGVLFASKFAVAAAADVEAALAYEQAITTDLTSPKRTEEMNSDCATLTFAAEHAAPVAVEAVVPDTRRTIIGAAVDTDAAGSSSDIALPEEEASLHPGVPAANSFVVMVGASAKSIGVMTDHPPRTGNVDDVDDCGVAGTASAAQPTSRSNALALAATASARSTTPARGVRVRDVATHGTTRNGTSCAKKRPPSPQPHYMRHTKNSTLRLSEMQASAASAAVLGLHSGKQVDSQVLAVAQSNIKMAVNGHPVALLPGESPSIAC